jgi:tetratricopeptide (TPR) repeat protein
LTWRSLAVEVIEKQQSICIEVLRELGEDLPQSFTVEQESSTVQATWKKLRDIKERDLLEMRVMDDKDKNLSFAMEFFFILTEALVVTKPELIPFAASRMIHLTMENGLSTYSIIAFIHLATTLCKNRINWQDIEGALQLGNAAISCFKERYHNMPALLPGIFASYYGHIAYHTNTLQLCADMLRRGFETGIALQKTSTAFLNSIQYIKVAIIAGEKLPTLLTNVNYYLNLAEVYKQDKLVKPYLLAYRIFISILINNGDSPNSTKSSKASLLMHFEEEYYFSLAMQLFWQGQSDNCESQIRQFLHISSDKGSLNSLIISFMHGLNSLHSLKMCASTNLTSKPLISVAKQAITVLTNASFHSQWNFTNKVSLFIQ